MPGQNSANNSCKIPMITDAELVAVRAADISTLCELDRRGLLLGAQETVDKYAARLECLRQNIQEMEASLEAESSFKIDDLTLQAGERIATSQFDKAREITDSQYGFSIDWVPGFYINPRMGWLFGGCAFYFFPDFFAVFILRRAFASRQRWLIYDRSELLAHELCHVARLPLQSHRYEEQFAYQTSTSAFRRTVGGTFRSAGDSVLLLGPTFLLLAAQICRLFVWAAIPIWPFWGLVLLTVVFLFTRGHLSQKRLKKACKNLQKAGVSATDPALFRCTDEEIDALADATENQATDILSQWQKSLPRWRVITQRFLSKRE